MTAIPGRNDSCPCGSGRKYKKCCLTMPAAAIEDCLRLAVQQLQTGLLPAAAATLEDILSERPDHADALHLSGHLADRHGDTVRAFDRLSRAIALAPRNAAYHNSLGIAHGRQLRDVDAIAAFRQALALHPDHLQALNNLALQLTAAGDFDEAERLYRRMLELQPGSAEGHSNLAQLFQMQGRLDEAAESYLRALQLNPRHLAAHSGYIGVLLYQPAARPSDVLAAARRFAEPHERELAAHHRVHLNEPDPDRRIKLGYVSADFRRHSVAYFIEPILARHDHSQVEVFCYSTGVLRDGVTERLQALADHWVSAHGLDEAALAERIRADGIDILIDLSGHSAGNRLLAFARKPAPIQITWFGYLATTGLAAMDYRLTDLIADPIRSSDSGQSSDGDHAEQLIRLPRSCLCYRPSPESPLVAPLPALTNGIVTFGSFNTPSKYNPRVIDLWSGILQAMPASRLLLKARGLDCGSSRARILAAFAAAGIAAERILLQPFETDDGAHLGRYADIDIGLDPFPHNGVTTTCAALWMGVPVVALRGDRHAARMCASVLTSAGLSECIADNLADFRNLALSLGGDLTRLAALRSGMRGRLRASVLLDEPGITRDVEAAYRATWRSWCERKSHVVASSVQVGK